MGGDYYADEDGTFELRITDAHGNELGAIHLNGLESGQELYRDLLLGRDR